MGVDVISLRLVYNVLAMAYGKAAFMAPEFLFFFGGRSPSTRLKYKITRSRDLCLIRGYRSHNLARKATQESNLDILITGASSFYSSITFHVSDRLGLLVLIQGIE